MLRKRVISVNVELILRQIYIIPKLVIINTKSLIKNLPYNQSRQERLLIGDVKLVKLPNLVNNLQITFKSVLYIRLIWLLFMKIFIITFFFAYQFYSYITYLLFKA